jgi:cyclopropane fatty-acyl-phospholipid synthase-like methyltransferase
MFKISQLMLNTIQCSHSYIDLLVLDWMHVEFICSIEHVENIGYHYYTTLIRWRDNFMANKDKILALGFDEKFIRTWEYYFIYCAAGFKSRTLGDYQIVFSRPGNTKMGSGF